MATNSANIQVNFPSGQPKGYEIAIASGSLDGLGAKLTSLGLGKKSNKVLVVSNPIIFKHYGDRTVNSLTSAGFEVATLILPAGERFKTVASLQKIYDAALLNKLERSSVIVALGGGVIGDMAGYAAATWLRGLDFVQVPTTLLAMTDSAIGGKTGINHPQGKNLIGAFHQPRLVWTDPEVLKTLPAREFRAAMAEVIKYGVIWDRELFEHLSKCGGTHPTGNRLDQIRYLKPETLSLILIHCAQAKAEIVSKDEKEGNLRAILNYGHTVGHAIETVTNYRLFNHGEAVGLGMVIAGAIAVELGFWQQSDQDAQLELIHKAKLPTQLPKDIDLKQIITAMSQDKKVSSGKVIFVMPKAIGNAVVTDQVDLDTVYKVLQKC
jgi:3-dehydroquinate synthase